MFLCLGGCDLFASALLRSSFRLRPSSRFCANLSALQFNENWQGRQMGPDDRLDLKQLGDNCYANEWTAAIDQQNFKVASGLRDCKSVARLSSCLRSMTFWLVIERSATILSLTAEVSSSRRTRRFGGGRSEVCTTICYWREATRL